MTAAGLGLLGLLPRRLKRSGLPVTPEMVGDFLSATTLSTIAAPADLYWTARIVLVKAPEDLPTFDRVFASWIEGREEPGLDRDAEGPGEEEQRLDDRPAATRSAVRLDAGEGAGHAASDLDGAGRKIMPPSAAGAREIAARIAADVDAALPPRRLRRLAPARRGRIDLRRTLRRERRLDGELERMAFQARPAVPRRLLLLVDVSGSMRSVSLDVLRIAHGLLRRLSTVEVFCFGTRLTRVTKALARIDLDLALGRTAEQVGDFDGGTRIGDSLLSFLDNPQHASLVRGAIVVIASDGLERGDPSAMVTAVHRLARQAHRLVWAHPFLADPRFVPETRAMKAALPAIDAFADASSLAAWTGLAETLAACGRAARGRGAARFRGEAGP